MTIKEIGLFYFYNPLKEITFIKQYVTLWHYITAFQK